MSATGLNPIDDPKPHRVSPERLAEFDRLMAQGGIEAVMDSLAAPTRTIRSFSPLKSLLFLITQRLYTWTADYIHH